MNQIKLQAPLLVALFRWTTRSHAPRSIASRKSSIVVVVCHSLFHSHFNACDVTTKLAPDAPSPRRILTQKTAKQLYTPIQTQSPLRVSPSSMNSGANFMRRPPYPNSAARCCRVRQVLLKQPLHAQLNSITSFTIADVVSSQRQDTLLGAFCSIPALSITVSFSTFSSLHSLREDYQGHHAVANGIDAKTRSSVPSATYVALRTPSSTSSRASP